VTTRHFVLYAIALLSITAMQNNPVNALSMAECSAKYKAAKTAGNLSGMKWNDFRKAQCGSDVSAAPAAVNAPSPATTTRATTAAVGNAVFPTAVTPKYSNQPAGKARMATCLDQYKTNKANNSNGGLKWIQKGGGHYSECSKRLKG